LTWEIASVTVTVRYVSILLHDVTHKTSETIELDGDSIILSDLIEEMVARYGEPFHSTLYTEEGNMRSHFHVLVNGRSMRFLAGLQTIVRDGDTVSFITPIGGG
jgi:MoaD family protein